MDKKLYHTFALAILAFQDIADQCESIPSSNAIKQKKIKAIKQRALKNRQNLIDCFEEIKKGESN